jgi:hypothetical protein
MPAQTVFKWRDGRGWLAVGSGSGTPSEIDEVRARALQRTSADGGLAVIVLNDDPQAGERLLDDLEDLGAPSGYVVDVIAEDDESIRERLREAAVIMIAGAPDPAYARSALTGAGIDGIGAAHANGAVILVEGLAAMAFGARLVERGGGISDGFAWIERTLIAPNVTDIGQYARAVLTTQPDTLAVGIGAGSALALGPDGQVEIWGAKRVSVALGSAYQTGE